MLPPRYVFVGGLHRSGTSLLARLIAGHPDVSAIEGAPVPENEGVYLQGAIPHRAGDGVPGRFGADPDHHLVEGCAFDTLETRRRLEADWAPWFDPSSPWRVEKSPLNLLRMRLYQQLFPLSQFIVVTRHPSIVAQATQKWTDLSHTALVRHWSASHRVVSGDLPHLHAVLTVRYESLLEDPARVLRGIAAFLDLRSAIPLRTAIRDTRGDYKDQTIRPWQMRRGALARWGYTPRPGEHTGHAPAWVAHPLRARRDAVMQAMGAA